VVAACARETRLVFLLEADTGDREKERRGGAVKTASYRERGRINR
jgi:hypothetical protein